VATPGKPAFQLRPGEEGLSVFDPLLVEPPLSLDEILTSFREGSLVMPIDRDVIMHCGLDVLEVIGHESLPERIRACHCEIRPWANMDRKAFKQALKQLES
jgi:hypothetical protein